MNPSLIIAGIPFFDTPAEVEGSPYWVDLWTNVNGYKIGLQVKPASFAPPVRHFLWVEQKHLKNMGTNYFVTISAEMYLLSLPKMELCLHKRREGLRRITIDL